MVRTGIAVFVIFGVISLILGSMHGDHWKRFLHAYVIGWAYIVTLANGDAVDHPAALPRARPVGHRRPSRL